METCSVFCCRRSGRMFNLFLAKSVHLCYFQRRKILQNLVLQVFLLYMEEREKILPDHYAGKFVPGNEVVFVIAGDAYTVLIQVDCGFLEYPLLGEHQ